MKTTRLLIRMGWVAGVLSAPLPVSASATMVVENADGAGTGFNDPTPATSVGGNSGTTLGAQRLNAVQYAADIWGKLLESPVPIVIKATFKDLPCTGDGTAQLAQASPYGAAAGIEDSGADPSVFYPSALANRLVGTDIFPDDPEIVAEFNGAIGSSACLPALRWYYGFDGNSGANVDLVTVVLHELGHGLGFTSFADLETGELLGDRGDIYTKYIFDKTTAKHWTEMSNQERIASSASARNVVWDGPHVAEEAPDVLASGSPTLSATPSPAGFTGLVSEANFGPLLSSMSAAIDADLVLGNPSDGCQQLNNASGKVVLLFESGSCHFGNMVNFAEVDGAVAVLIARDVGPNSPPTPLDADAQDLPNLNQYIDIPSLSVTVSDANLFKTAIASGQVRVHLASDPNRLTGADASGKVFLNASDPIDNASSIVHWDPLVRPNLLMEPAIVEQAAYHRVDLSLALLRDIGWFPTCGNGQRDGAEECDNGDSNSNTAPDACRRTCKKPYCGDGVKDTGEQCDEGSNNSDTAPDTCRKNCLLANCSDGVVDTGEMCDGGNVSIDSGTEKSDGNGTPDLGEAGAGQDQTAAGSGGFPDTENAGGTGGSAGGASGSGGSASETGGSIGEGGTGGTETDNAGSKTGRAREPVDDSESVSDAGNADSGSSLQSANVRSCGCRAAGIHAPNGSTFYFFYLLVLALIAIRRWPQPSKTS